MKIATSYIPPRMEKLDTPEGRIYIINGIKYPSVTTVLSHFKKDSISSWKKRVGEEEANKVIKRATTIGTEVHSLIYSHVFEKKQDPLFEQKYPKIFENIQPWFEKMKPVYMEVPMWTDSLGIAGTPDFIGYFDSVPYIIDFKTEKHPKEFSEMESYIYQLNTYSVMVAERLGVHIKNLKILMMNVARPQTDGTVTEYNFSFNKNIVKRVFHMVRDFKKNNKTLFALDFDVRG